MDLNSISKYSISWDTTLEKLPGDSRLSVPEKVGEVCLQFEAIMLRQILQTARKPHFDTKEEKSSSIREIYRDLVTTQIADSISNTGAFGLAQSLKVQLSKQLPSKAPGIT